MKDVNSIKDLLGCDIESDGVPETIENVTESVCQMERVHEAIGKAIFKDGRLLEKDLEPFVNAAEIIEDVAWECEEVMNMLEFYASNSEKFMERL